jgi:hypothetical protein
MRRVVAKNVKHLDEQFVTAGLFVIVPVGRETEVTFRPRAVVLPLIVECVVIELVVDSPIVNEV